MGVYNAERCGLSLGALHRLAIGNVSVTGDCITVAGTASDPGGHLTGVQVEIGTRGLKAAALVQNDYKYQECGLPGGTYSTQAQATNALGEASQCVSTAAHVLLNACIAKVSMVDPLRQRAQPSTNPNRNISTIRNQSYCTWRIAHSAGVLTPLVVADITKGSGRFNLAQGMVGTFSGIGAAVSTTAINVVAQNFGNAAGFMAIAAVALAAVAVQWAWLPETKQPYPVHRPPMGFGAQGSTT
jgi:hypothetical protein